MPSTVNLKHGHARRGQTSSTYYSWSGMHHRCRSPNIPRYGGRGITVCERWEIFENFLADMGEKPTRQHSIERKDNDGNYEPDNCYWATKAEQQHNRSDTAVVVFKEQSTSLVELAKTHNIKKSTIRTRLKRGCSPEDAVLLSPAKRKTMLTFKEQTKDIYEWAEITGIPKETIRARMRLGHSPERILTTPVKRTSLGLEMTHDGVTHNAKEWSRITGIAHSTILYRLEHRWPIAKILTTPDGRKGKG